LRDVPQFPQGAVHYVAISQVDTDSQHVWVEDPLLGPGHAMEFAFWDFIYNYGYSSAPAKTPGDAPEPVVAGFQKITKVNL
jgi:hypothetical protein